jgi:hypothetical protein
LSNITSVQNQQVSNPSTLTTTHVIPASSLSTLPLAVVSTCLSSLLCAYAKSLTSSQNWKQALFIWKKLKDNEIERYKRIAKVVCNGNNIIIA